MNFFVRDYFADKCLYNDEAFERQFRISKGLYLRISNVLETRYEYFKQKPGARGRLDFSIIKKRAIVLKY